MKHLKLDKYRKKLEKWLDMGLDVQDIYLQYQELQKSLVELYDFSKDYPPFKKMKILLENWLAFNIPTKVFYSQVMNKSDEN